MIEHAHTNNSTLALARTVLSREAEALTNLADRLGDTFLKAVQCLLNCKGRVVVSGVGKSGHIGCKLAATLGWPPWTTARKPSSRIFSGR